MSSNMRNAHDNTTISPVTNQSSVYYIHPSDHSASQLVSVKFNGTGFASWKRSMRLSLFMKNKLGFVDGPVAKPDINSSDLHAWERCHDMICAWLLTNLDETIAQSVLYFKNANEIWNDLEERFGYTSMAQIYTVEQQLAQISQGNKSISEFFTEIRTLWDALVDADPLPCCTCNKCICNVNQKIHQKQQSRRLIQFMMTLTDKYHIIRGNILMQQTLPTITHAFRLFSQEEKHQDIANLTSNTESLAFMVDNKKSYDNRQ